MSKVGTKQKVLDLLAEKAPWLNDNLNMLVYHGSRSYGTNVEGSDTDIKGFFVPGQKEISNPYETFEQVGSHDKDYDTLIFDFRKFLRLAGTGNPGVAELFWIDKSDWIFSSPAWEYIHSHRDMFFTKAMVRKFMGIAIGELRALNRGIENGVSPTSIRYELYEKYGFDTKAAASGLRFSRMCREMAVDGQVLVRRKDADELILIRQGQCDVDKIVEEIEYNLVNAGGALAGGILPDEVDQSVIRSISEKLLKDRLFGVL